MDYCHVSNQASIHCDEPEQYSANELFLMLEENECVIINSSIYYYDDITEMLDDNDFEEADENEERYLYINKIAELMECE